MSDQYKFISGIYNYCDYVCEKCAFTHRCYLHWSEHYENGEDLSDHGYDELGGDLEGFDPGYQQFADPFERSNNLHSEQRTQEIIAPSVEIVELLDPVVEELAEQPDLSAPVRKALSLVMENYLLITVKYYRAVHHTDFNVDAVMDETGLYEYIDTEKTLLALKSFNWNLRYGVHLLRRYVTDHDGVFRQAVELSRKIEQRIDTELLPATRTILARHSSETDGDDIP